VLRVALMSSNTARTSPLASFSSINGTVAIAAASIAASSLRGAKRRSNPAALIEIASFRSQ
jgi:hypothetical protein